MMRVTKVCSPATPLAFCVCFDTRMVFMCARSLCYLLYQKKPTSFSSLQYILLEPMTDVFPTKGE
jgi:hypothetical protein